MLRSLTRCMTSPQVRAPACPAPETASGAGIFLSPPEHSSARHSRLSGALFRLARTRRLREAVGLGRYNELSLPLRDKTRKRRVNVKLRDDVAQLPHPMRSGSWTSSMTPWPPALERSLGPRRNGLDVALSWAEEIMPGRADFLVELRGIRTSNLRSAGAARETAPQLPGFLPSGRGPNAISAPASLALRVGRARQAHRCMILSCGPAPDTSRARCCDSESNRIPESVGF